MEIMSPRSFEPGIAQEADLEAIYESVFPAVARFVSKRNGSLEDAKDVFHDALVIFYEKGNAKDFRINTSAEAYLLGIARHLWFMKFRKDSKEHHRPLEANDEYIAPEQEVDINTFRLLDLVMATGKKCMDLLHAFYYRKLPAEKLSKDLGYRSIRSATVRKYKCMEKIRNKVIKESLSYADFLD